MSVKQVREFLTNRGVKEYLIDKSCEIRNKMDIIVKKTPPISFFCLYQAHREFGKCVPYIDIAYQMGIDHHTVSKILSKFAAHKTNYEPPSLDITVLDLIIYYNERLDKKSMEKRIVKQYKMIMDKLKETNEKILDRKPFIIAAAIIIISYSELDQNWDDFFHFDTKILNEIINKIYTKLKI